MSLTAEQALPLISQYESGNKNILNTQGSTASGYFQIINGTWQQFAPQAGVSLLQYPTAMSAPQDVQTAVATTIYNRQGFQPWASNAALMAAVGNQQGDTTVTDLPDTAPIAVGGSTNAGAAGNSTGGSSLFSSIWNYISRGVLLFAGFMLVFIALAALFWQSKGAAVSRSAISAAKLAA